MHINIPDTRLCTTSISCPTDGELQGRQLKSNAVRPQLLDMTDTNCPSLSSHASLNN